MRRWDCTRIWRSRKPWKPKAEEQIQRMNGADTVPPQMWHLFKARWHPHNNNFFFSAEGDGKQRKARGWGGGGAREKVCGSWMLSLQCRRRAHNTTPEGFLGKVNSVSVLRARHMFGRRVLFCSPPEEASAPSLALICFTEFQQSAPVRFGGICH